MTDPGEADELRAQARRAAVRNMQIICIALVNGAVIFLAVAGYLVLSRGQGLNPPAAGFPVLSAIALVMLLTEGPLALILPGAVTKTALQKIAAGTWTPPLPDDETKLLAVRQTSLILRLALWEGVAFMSVIAFLMEGDPLVLTITGVA